MPTGNTIAKGANTALNCNNRGRQLEAEGTALSAGAAAGASSRGRSRRPGLQGWPRHLLSGLVPHLPELWNAVCQTGKGFLWVTGKRQWWAAQEAASSSAWQSGPTLTHYSRPSVLSSMTHWAWDQRERVQEGSRDEGTPRVKPSEKHLKQLGRLSSGRASEGRGMAAPLRHSDRGRLVQQGSGKPSMARRQLFSSL